jgi:hypothetical protein
MLNIIYIECLSFLCSAPLPPLADRSFSITFYLYDFMIDTEHIDVEHLHSGATDYGLDDRGSNSGKGWEFFSSTPCPDRLWGPPSLLLKGYGRLFPWG